MFKFNRSADADSDRSGDEDQADDIPDNTPTEI